MRNAFNGYASYPQIQFHEKAAMITRQNRAPFFDDWVRLRSKLKGEEHKDTLLAANNYASSFITQERFEEAKSLMCKMMPVARRILGESRELTLRMKWTYAQSLYKDASATLNDLREAESTLKDAVRLARRVLGSTHPTVVQMENSLQNARAILGARESGREVKIIR